MIEGAPISLEGYRQLRVLMPVRPSLDILQARVTRFQSNVPEPLQTVERLHQGVQEEVRELGSEVTIFDGTTDAKERIEDEGADVIIRVMGIFAITQGNLYNALERKISEMEEKYHPTKLQPLIDRGMTYEEACAALKRQWNDKRGDE